MIFKRKQLDLIQKRISLIDVIESFLDFKREEVVQVYDCPFCSEGKEAFYIIDEKYHCLNCRASGDAITFLMCHKKMSFVETIKHLAKVTKVSLAEYSSKKTKKKK